MIHTEEEKKIHCARCGRELKHFVAYGSRIYGRDCAKKVGIKQKETMRVEML